MVAISKYVVNASTLTLQRQIYLRPMQTPDIEKTFKGVIRWISWKIAFLVYLLCATLPIALCIICLLVLAIERRSTIFLPVIMSAMLHPAIAVPIGVCAKLLEQLLASFLFKSSLTECPRMRQTKRKGHIRDFVETWVV